MSLIAELHLSENTLVLLPALQAAPGMRIQREWAIHDRMSDPVVFVWAWGGAFEQFEAAIPDDPTVREYERVDDTTEKRLYRVGIERSTVTSPAPIDRKTDASRISMTTSADGATLELRLADREALRTYIDLLREEGFTVELLRAHPAGEGTEGTGLSEKQAEALEEARAAGYFEVPRETDLETLAEKLDVSEQAVSERIRRGLSAVLADTFADRDESERTTGSRSTAAGETDR